MTADYQGIAQSLSQALRLALPPIAIGFADALPPGVAQWSTPVPAGCRFWQEAAQATFATTAADHDLCAIGTFTHNLAVTPAHEVDRRDALGVFAELGYVRPEDLPLIPVLNQYGIDLTHFGIILLVNLTIGQLTPPVGVLLFVASSVGKVRLGLVVREVWPYVLALLVALLAITYVPQLSLWLPQALK